jgi:hypothetical protein
MSCYLTFSGAFDPEFMIAESPLPWEIAYRTGDAIRRGGVRECSSISVQISDADFSEMHQQFDEAEVYVNFGLCFPEDCMAFSRSVPTKVIRMAACCDAAIVFSFYPVRSESE